MRIIISENKLERAVDRWLSKEYSEMDIYDHSKEPWVYYLDENGDIIFLNQFNDNEYELYFARDVMEYIIRMFSINKIQLVSIVKYWFEEHTGLKPYKVIPCDFTPNFKKDVRWHTKKRLSN